MPKKKKEVVEELTELKEDFDALEPEEQKEVINKVAEGEFHGPFEDIPEPAINEDYVNTNITTYAHHGIMVQVRRDLKGKHRRYSLCYQCKHFKPDTLNNCHIAQSVFENCEKWHITTPVWECPSFKLK